MKTLKDLKGLRGLNDHRDVRDTQGRSEKANIAENQAAAAAAATNSAMTRKAESRVGLEEFLQRLEEDNKKAKRRQCHGDSVLEAGHGTHGTKRRADADGN